MRTTLALVAASLLTAGCPAAQPVATPAPPPSSGPATATPSICLALPGPGDYPPPLERLSVVGRELRFCRTEDAGLRCYAFDLDAGRLAPAPASVDPSVDPSADPEAPRRVVIDEARGEAKLCNGIGSACRKLDLGRARARIERVAFSGSKRMLAVTASPEDGGPAEATVFDVDSARVLGRLVINPTADYECGAATFVGETILALEDVCAGPAGVAWLARPDSGHRIAWVGGRPDWGAWDVDFAHVDGPLWAFREQTGAEVVIQNVSTGEVVYRFDLRDTLPRGPDGDLLTDPSGGAMLETDRGELVVVHDGPGQGVVVVLDPKARRRVAVLRMPACE